MRGGLIRLAENIILKCLINIAFLAEIDYLWLLLPKEAGSKNVL